MAYNNRVPCDQATSRSSGVSSLSSAAATKHAGSKAKQPNCSPHSPPSQNGAQHTVASLLGLGLSVWFASAVSGASGSASGSRVWGWYLALTLVHLLANYAAMRTLALRSLNPARASLLVSEYLSRVREARRARGDTGRAAGAGAAKRLQGLS